MLTCRPATATQAIVNNNNIIKFLLNRLNTLRLVQLCVYLNLEAVPKSKGKGSCVFVDALFGGDYAGYPVSFIQNLELSIVLFYQL